jgi:alpha-D-ribose 1-methylphosphonate 5-triphosphate diphosphatase
MSEVLHLANARLVLSEKVATGQIDILHGQIARIDEGNSVPRGAVN